MAKPSYHEVVVTVNGREYRPSKNYAFKLVCSKAGGWQLFFEQARNSYLMGGEFDGCRFTVKVNDMIICDTGKNNGDDGLYVPEAGAGWDGWVDKPQP